MDGAARMMALLAQTIPMPTEGQDAALWLLGVVVLLGGPAIGYLLSRMLKSMEDRIGDWKLIGTTSTAELSKTIDSLRALTDAVERGARDNAAAIERHGQAVATIGQDVRKMGETLGTLDRRLERLEEPGGRRAPDRRGD